MIFILMTEAKPWTRNQKLMLAGVMVTVLGMFIGKITIDIKYIQDRIDNITIKTAEIDSLKARIANFEKFKTTCPEGTIAQTILTQNSLEVSCI